jgi:hypothetical protein
MTVQTLHSLKDYSIFTQTSQIGASPVAAYVAVPKAGRFVGVKATQSAAITGTCSVAVAVNGGTAISDLALTITGGGAGTEFSANEKPLSTNAYVNEDDVISFTPSGATGSASGYFQAIIKSN